MQTTALFLFPNFLRLCLVTTILGDSLQYHRPYHHTTDPKSWPRFGSVRCLLPLRDVTVPQGIRLHLGARLQPLDLEQRQL